MFDVLDAVVRYEFAQGLMRPLAEGIALFAEHDACTGFTHTISTPMAFAGTLFAQGLATRTNPPWSKMPLVIAGGRLTTAHVRRKADLLMQPFNCSKGGYLPGYLMVKNLWLHNLMALECTHFMDTDFYLQFVRSYFYDDWELVACLLDFDRSDIGALGPIAARIQARMHSFTNGNERQREAERFEQHGLTGRSRFDLKVELGTFQLSYDQFDGPSDRDLVGQQRLSALYVDLFGTWPTSEVDQMLYEMDRETLQFWSTITLGHTNLDGNATGDRLQFNHEGKTLFSTAMPSSLQAGWVGKLDVDIVVDTAQVGMFGFVSAGSKLIDTWKLSNSDIPDHLKSPHIHRTSRSGVMQISQAALVEAMNDESIQIALNHARSELNRITDGIYLFRAIAERSDAEFEEIRNLMHENGLLPLLNNRLQLLSDAAAASLCASVDHNLDSISQFHKWSQSDAYSAISEIGLTLEKHLRLPVFAINNRQLFASGI